MTHVNYVQAAINSAQADWKSKHGDTGSLAPDMLGTSIQDTPHGDLICTACKLDFDGRGWFGFKLGDKRVSEADLNELGIGKDPTDNPVIEWANAHILPSPVMKKPAPLLRELHRDYMQWAKKRGDVMIFGIVKFTRVLSQQCGVALVRRADGNAAPWVVVKPGKPIDLLEGTKPIDTRSR